MRLPRHPLYCTLLLASVLYGHTDPANAQEGASRFAQRQMYREALEQLFSGHETRFRRLAEQLADYPLAPYLEYFDMSRHISRYSFEEVERFATRYSDSPIAAQLIRSWLYSQARRGHWEAFVEHYSEERTSPILACDYLHALYRTGQQQRALELTSERWLVGFSQPDECDPIFRVWGEAGYLTDERAWQRLGLTLRAGNTSLARYVTNQLSRELRGPGALYRQVHATPALLHNRGRFQPDSARMREIILHGIARLARSDATEATVLWRYYVEAHAFAPEEIDATYLELALQLAAQRDPDQLLDTLPVDLTGNDPLLEARIRLALALEDWGQVLVFINALPEERQEIPRWRFWKARALSLSGDPADQQAAEEIWRAMAAERGYYAFLAADRVDYPYAMENLPNRIDRDELLRVEGIPALQRALELFVLNERTRARGEWQFATRDFDDRELAAAARVAQTWGWYEQSIATLIRSDQWDDLRVRFPLAYHDTFLAESREADIPVTWSLAIARQESAFMPDAKSSAGALGVMQLMPATARLTAERFDIPYRDINDLTDPQTNISLGTAYLGQMWRRFDGNRILASAAYNAGPSRVEEWLAKGATDYDVWIETIPFPETRGYVQNILYFTVIFAYRLDEYPEMILPREREQFARWRLSQRAQEEDADPS